MVDFLIWIVCIGHCGINQFLVHSFWLHNLIQGIDSITRFYIIQCICRQFSISPNCFCPFLRYFVRLKKLKVICDLDGIHLCRNGFRQILTICVFPSRIQIKGVTDLVNRQLLLIYRSDYFIIIFYLFSYHVFTPGRHPGSFYHSCVSRNHQILSHLYGILFWYVISYVDHNHTV